VHLTIYSKPGCHLCDEMKAVVARVAAGNPDISIEEIDISTDPQLAEQYGLEIPVLMIDGRKAAKFRVSEKELTRILEGARGKG
jgi:thiol-disulfide isomerase/thioredoxin